MHSRHRIARQCGPAVADYRRARELARQAAALGAGGPAPWLAAAACDRWLTHRGKPQKYGTQYRAEGDRWVPAPVDPATTDAELAAGEPFRTMAPVADDPVPSLQAVDLGGRTGVVVGMTRGRTLIVWRSSPGTCRMASGDIAPAELLAPARSLVPGER